MYSGKMRPGFGSGGGNTSSSRNSKPMGMGIQFVKSSEVMNPAVSTASSSSSSQSTYGQNNSPASTPPRFGAPAQNFSCRPSFGGQAFVKSGDKYCSTDSSTRSSGSGKDYQMPGQVNLNRGGGGGGGSSFSKGPAPLTNTFARTPEAKPVVGKEEYYSAWKKEKDPDLQKIRKLAFEVVALKSDRPNAKDKLHSAANRVPIRIEFNTEPVFGARNSNSFLCYVFVEGISAASGQGVKIKDSKTNAYEAALQKVLMPHLRIVQLDPSSRELQGSREPFTTPAPPPSTVPLSRPGSSTSSTNKSAKEMASQHKESNLEAAGIKRRFNEYKPLEDFVIVEPKIPIPDCTPAHTLRRSADFNHMLLEYEYFFKGESARCVLKIENQILADVNGVSKVAAKNIAAAQGLKKLKEICWVIKTKQAVDSNTKISKEEMLMELGDSSDTIADDNIGNKLLRKMGWSGGGVGKDGSGIAEPVSLKSVLNREGLGLGTARGITDDYRRKVREVIENYAASDNQEDLVFNCDFRLDERQIIHDECRRLNLKSKSRGKGVKRYLCVRRKRSANQLFDHLMACGGETARYQLVPPGSDMYSSHPGINHQQGQAFGKGTSMQYQGNGSEGGPRSSLLPTPNVSCPVPNTGNNYALNSNNGAPNAGKTFTQSGKMLEKNVKNSSVSSPGQFGKAGSNSQMENNQTLMSSNLGAVAAGNAQFGNNVKFGNNMGPDVPSGNPGDKNSQVGKQQANDRGHNQGPAMNHIGSNQAIVANQAGNNQAGMNQAGNNQAGMNQAGNNQAGMNQAGNNQPHGMNQFGNGQIGMNQFANNQIGFNQFHYNQAGGMNQFGTAQTGGMNQFGNNQIGMNRFGNNQANISQFGNKHSGMNQFGNQPVMNQFGNQSGMNQFGNQPGMNQFGNQPGMNQFGNQPGMNQFGNQPGMNQFSNQSGMNQFSNQSGMNQFSSQPGMNQFNNQPGMNQFSNQSGMNQFSNQPGMNQFQGNVSGMNQFGNQAAMTQYMNNQGGITQFSGNGNPMGAHQKGNNQSADVKQLRNNQAGGANQYGSS